MISPPRSLCFLYFCGWFLLFSASETSDEARFWEFLYHIDQAAAMRRAIGKIE
jgi:hypothetical protein